MSSQLVVAMNGVTGDIGYNEHLLGSILQINRDGGVVTQGMGKVQLCPVLVGRSESKLSRIAERHEIERWTTSVESLLTDPGVDIYFDCQASADRERALLAALRAGKHVYAEKPIAMSLAGAQRVLQAAYKANVCGGVVHDKLYLPGLQKLARLVESGFFGEIFTISIDFGYWIFDGTLQRAQRPSWNYRTADGGGLVPDMFTHWRYIVEALGGRIGSIVARTGRSIAWRVGEDDVPYEATAEDRAYAILELTSGATVTLSSSWCTRPYRDDLIEIHIDGANGSAVAGTRECLIQPGVATGNYDWSPDHFDRSVLRSAWMPMPGYDIQNQPYRCGWENFVRHIVDGVAFPSTLDAGVRDAEFVEKITLAAETGCAQRMDS